MKQRDSFAPHPRPLPHNPQSLGDHLQASLGTGYTIDRELGGGGMSRVFVATDVSLGRAVVIKVLPAAAIESEVR